MWSNFRHRRGLDRRITRDDELISWAVKGEHRHRYPVTMLRAEARRRSGQPISEDAVKRLISWKEMLKSKDLVVHYDPNAAEGFIYVKRKPDDDDLIRRPKLKTTLRRNADQR